MSSSSTGPHSGAAQRGGGAAQAAGGAQGAPGEGGADRTRLDGTGETAASTFEELLAEASECSQDDIDRIEAILYRAHRAGISGGRLKVIEARIDKVTELGAAVVTSLSKSERERHERHGVISTADAAADAYIADLSGEVVDLLHDEGAVWFYENAPSGTAPTEKQNFWVPVSSEDLEEDLLCRFPGLPLLGREHGRKETLRRVRTKLSRRGHFSEAPDGLNCLNGFATWAPEQERVVLLDHAPELKARILAPLEFNEGAAAPTFLEGLRRVLPDASKRKALQEAFGSLLFGVMPEKDPVRRMLVLHGPTRSGKSTLIETLLMIHPASVVQSVPPDEWTCEFARARLVGVRLNYCTELRARAASESALVKRILACETVTGRHRFGQTFEFRPRAFHVFATNDLPRVQDKSGAIERRALVIEFARTLTDAEVDGTFLASVREELPGVLAWAAEGLERVMKQTQFTIPAGHREALVYMQHHGDPLAMFAHTQLEKAPGERLSSAALQNALGSYMQMQGHHLASASGAMRRLSPMMEAVFGATRSRTNNAPYYEGVRLRPGLTPSPEAPDEMAGL